MTLDLDLAIELATILGIIALTALIVAIPMSLALDHVRGEAPWQVAKRSTMAAFPLEEAS